MKSLLIILAIFNAALGLPAQTNAPVRLALVSETDETLAAADVLTAELSGHKNLQLLERNEIEKVYREQGLSAGNKDYLKLGQVLGADGLLLLDVTRTKQGTNLVAHLTARLIAVKPGVILSDGIFAWPVKDTAQWAESVSSYLNLLLPKLAVSASDAIPISVVNLRSAVASAEGAETEEQLKLLTIQRLSQEKELFVLERQKMQLLSEEKSLQADDSAFWNGSYLLEGVVDQNGYSKDTLTVNARLTPSKGGAPVLIAASGSRTNLAAVVNQLAMEVNQALKINSAVKEWNAADEAAQYFAEAQWALRWGAYSEAQAAADSAWALGKKDLACAIVRIRSYENSLKVPAIAENGGIDASIAFSVEKEDRAELTRTAKKIHETYPAAFFYTNKAGIYYIALSGLPDLQTIDRATHALELYYEFSRTSTNGQPKILWSGAGWNDWHSSEWYELGIEDLIAASKILLPFSLAAAPQKPSVEKLADLRALARSVAGLISQSPTIHDSYFVGDRVVTHDELGNTIGDDGGRNPNIFDCKLRWGSLWQETPEDCVALYREMMASPVFCYLHRIFWSHKPQSPVPVSFIDHDLEPARLIAWNEKDRQRVPPVWNGFVQELEASTNVLLQLEARAVKFADADDENEVGKTFTNFFDALFAYRDALVTNNVEVLFLNWGADDLIGMPHGTAAATEATPDSLRQQYYSGYFPKLEAMDQEYWNETIPARQTALAFEKQKQYLANFAPYEFQTFQATFASRSFTKAQAAELLPLIAAYKSNLTARARSVQEKFEARSDAQWIEVSLEKGVNEIVNPPAPNPALAQIRTPKPVVINKVVAPAPAATHAPEVPANILFVNKFLKNPKAHFQGDDDLDVGVFSQRWSEGKLLMDVRYGKQVFEFDANGAWNSTRTAALSAIAIFNPVDASWKMASFPEITNFTLSLQNDFQNRMVLAHGDLFACDAGEIKKYDSQGDTWRSLGIPEKGRYQLFEVGGRLLAANENVIFEIADENGSTRNLASTRRRPAVSALDALDRFGSPVLFAGLNQSLCASIGNTIYRWDGTDWRQVPTVSFNQEDFFDDAVIFRSLPDYGSDNPANLWIWFKDQAAPDLALHDRPRPHPGIVNFGKPDNRPVPSLWKSLNDDYLTRCAATYFQSNLYLFVDHATVTNVNGRWTVSEKDGHHAKLVCLSRDLPEPIVVPLKFDLQQGLPPLKSFFEKSVPGRAPWNIRPAWMHFAGDTLYIGQPDTPGIWAIPRSEIESTLAARKQNQVAQRAGAEAQAKAAAEQAREYLLAKFDRNHNGAIDADEMEAALDDPVFVESKLDVIDANHNGWLDASELVYFDANTNKILEPKEQAGIEIAQHLLADKLLKRFDADGEGTLDHSEFDGLAQSNPGAIARPTPGFPVPFPDENHDGKIDLAELERFLKQQLRQQLRPRGAAGAAYFGQMIANPDRKADDGQSFKAYVELFWQNAAAAPRESSDAERERVLQQLKQKRNAEAAP